MSGAAAKAPSLRVAASGGRARLRRPLPPGLRALVRDQRLRFTGGNRVRLHHRGADAIDPALSGPRGYRKSASLAFAITSRNEAGN